MRLRVEDIAARQPAAMSTGPFGSSISAKFFVSSGVPVLRGSNLSADIDTRLCDDGLVFVSTEKAREFQRSVARRGDLVFTCWGTINQVGLIDEHSKYDEYIVSNKQMKLTVDPLKVDSKFLYYLFSTPEKQAEILDNGIGSSVPGFNLGQLKAHEVLLPPLSEQREIARFLDMLDRRVRLLRSTNATLEAIARAMFKSWFLDFDPVHAKAEGREPESMDAATATLFPAEFEESALGLIPKGWGVGKLEAICSNPRAQAKPGQMPGETPYIGLEHMPRKSIALDSAGTAEGLESGKFWFERNDVLFGKLRPYFHKVGLAPGRGVCSTDILVLRPKQSCWLGFLAMHASSDTLIAHTTQLSNGARMPRTSWQDVGGFGLTLPSQSVVAAFDAVVRPLFERIHANIECRRVLASLRDTLLPRLISGKLRLPEAQAQLEDVLA